MRAPPPRGAPAVTQKCSSTPSPAYPSSSDLLQIIILRPPAPGGPWLPAWARGGGGGGGHSGLGGAIGLGVRSTWYSCVSPSPLSSLPIGIISAPSASSSASSSPQPHAFLSLVVSVPEPSAPTRPQRRHHQSALGLVFAGLSQPRHRSPIGISLALAPASASTPTSSYSLLARPHS